MYNQRTIGLSTKAKCIYRAIVFDEEKMEKLFQWRDYILGIEVFYMTKDTMHRMKMKLNYSEMGRLCDAIIWAVLDYPCIELA